jgi:glutamine synthetase
MSANDIKKLVDEKEAKFIDYRFTNTLGKEQHVFSNLGNTERKRSRC